ncbi:stromelysin-2-like [Lycorma delicatula]|uniref:stromelysin-2-like n=1 Tax=Lycorma delicatula TaxID=130591 RepID=UPI003F50E0F3
MVLSEALLVMFFFILLQVLNTVNCRPTPDSSENNEEIDPVKAIGFMKQFGYLENTSLEDSESLYSGDDIKNALKEVQLYGGIPQTGILDNTTIELMKSPRCGVPETRGLSSSNRTKRYILSGSQWKKYRLTYYVANWPSGLSERNVRTNMRRAFDSWSSYSQLKFIEVPDMNADIIISFASGSHGDGFPFDGRGSVLAHAFMPGESSSLQGDIHFDDDEQWQDNPGPFDDGVDFFSVAVHELGHSLGLMHSPEDGSVMNPYYKQYKPGTFQLAYDDILAVYELYVARRTSDSSGDTSYDKNDDDPTVSSTTTTTTQKSTTRITTPYTRRPPISTSTKKTTITYIGDDESVDDHKKHDDQHGIPDAEDPVVNGNDGNIIICHGNFDAVANLRGELFFFKNRQVWRLDEPGHIQEGYPVTTDRFFRTPGEPLIEISAAYQRPTDSNIVIFSGKDFWVYDGNQFIDESPQPISRYGLPDYVEKVDAAMVWQKNKKTYLFRGDRYWRYDEFNKSMDENYPRSMGNFRNIPTDLDAAMTWKDGITYFFKGKQYWGFNNTWKKADADFPRSATSYWLGCKS